VVVSPENGKGRIVPEEERSRRTQSVNEYVKRLRESGIPHPNNGKSSSPATEFRPGHVPWNKDSKGIHFSPETEFKSGEHVSPSTEFKPGQPAWNRRFTDEQEEEIRAKWRAGQSQYSLAREYDIDRKCIKRIVSKVSQ
jgi:hypothetical protein